jgi:hypothetical protein
MNLSQLLDLVNESDYQTLPNKSCRVPTGESILGSNAFKRLDFKKNRMIIVERVDQEFFRDCKVKLSKFSFSREAYDFVRACRTNRIIIIDGIDNINSLLTLFTQDQDFYKILPQIPNQEINYNEPNYYRLADGGNSNRFEEFYYQEDNEKDANLTIEEIYERDFSFYLDDWSDEFPPSFDTNSPFDEENYQMIDEWVELITYGSADGRRIENSQLISKRLKGYSIPRNMEFIEDGLERYDEEGEPYIREILIGNKLLSSKQFTNLTVREPF